MTFTFLCIQFFFATSLLLYVIFGGADFGAGILELFLGKSLRNEQRRLISEAIAPVWEANHIWLILAVVILFVSFPSAYTIFSTYLYIPLLAMLVGIVARGCAFTFRHYDTFNKEVYAAYSRTFALASVWTPLCLGIIAGAALRGNIDPTAHDFFASFVAPWLNLFCVAVGVFMVALCAFLAATYLMGEAKESSLKRIFANKAKGALVVMLLAGAAVFAVALGEGFPLVELFFEKPLAAACFLLASLTVIFLWKSLQNFSWYARYLAAACVGLVLVGWFSVQYPNLLMMRGGSLTLEGALAPQATQNALVTALLVGSLLIFPALAYLLKIFKLREPGG